MKKTVHTITLAITAIVLLGLNQVNAQEQKDTRSYSNASLNPIHSVLQQKNGSNNLTSLGKKAPKFMLDSFSSLTWDYNSKTYSVYQDGLKYYYDANGNNALNISYDKNMFTEQLEPFFKNTITFNNNNKIILVKGTSRNPLSNEWQNQRMNEYAYDSTGNNTYYRESGWNRNSNNYEPITSYSYAYNLSNKVTIEIDTQFGSTPLVIYKIDYTYDIKGNNTLKTTYRWWDGAQWKLSSKDEYTFDANNNNTLHISYDYDWNTTMIGNEKNEYTIDANGNPILAITYNWNSSLNQWIIWAKRSTTYNSSVNFSDVAIPLVQHGNLVSLPKNAIANETTQYYIDGQWQNDSKTNYYYKDFTPSTSIKEMKILQTNVFPNPSAGNITVLANQAFTKIEVYDLTGKLAYTTQNRFKANEVEIDLSSLNNGIYIINIETINGGVSKSKIIISK